MQQRDPPYPCRPMHSHAALRKGCYAKCLITSYVRTLHVEVALTLTFPDHILCDKAARSLPERSVTCSMLAIVSRAFRAAKGVLCCRRGISGQVVCRAVPSAHPVLYGHPPATRKSLSAHSDAHLPNASQQQHACSAT